MEQHFEAIIRQIGKRVGIVLPFDPAEAWGTKARYDVTGTINEVPIRGPLLADGDHYFLGLGPAWRRDCNITTGMTVTVRLAAEGPQVGTMAADLTAAFATAPAAIAFFNTLPSFYRKNYMRWINGAKRPETRAKRIQELIELLSAEKRER